MELTSRERRAVMLETQTPAYALTSETRRATDSIYRRAKHLREAFKAAHIDVPVSVCALIPHQHKYVSGLNVPANFKTLVGKDELRAFKRTMDKAKRRLVKRNAEPVLAKGWKGVTYA